MKNLNTEELEAATFRRLLNHLSNRTDVQNLDLMNLAGFCRNCLSRWYSEEAEKKGITIRVASPKLVMEEAPESYKDVTEVVNTCHDAGISKKAVKLRPLAVVKG